MNGGNTDGVVTVHRCRTTVLGNTTIACRILVQGMATWK